MIRSASIRRNLPAYSLSIAAICALALQIWYGTGISDPKRIVSRAEARMRSLDAEMVRRLETLCADTGKDGFHRDFLHQEPSADGISFYLYEEDRLVAWTDNGPALPFDTLNSIRQSGLLQLANGDYWTRTMHCGHHKALALLSVHNRYPIENKFLRNTFNPAFGLPASTGWSDQGFDFHAPDATVIGKIAPGTPALPDLLIAGWWIVLLLFTGSFVLFSRRWKGSNSVRLSLVLGLLLIRALMVNFQVPEALFHSSVFSPSVYAAEIFYNSVGDLFLNGLTLLLVAFALFNGRALDASPRKRWLLSASALAGFAAALYHLVGGMVLDARVSFDVSDLSAVNGFSILMLTALGLHLLAGALVITWISGSQTGSLRFGRSMSALFVVTAFVALLVFRFNHVRDLEERRRLAHKVMTERDPVAEYLFLQESERMRSDTMLAGLVASPSDFIERIRNHFIRNELGRFEWEVIPFDPSGNPVDGSTNSRLEQVRAEFLNDGKATLAPGLFSLPSEGGRMRYGALLPVCGSTGDTVATVAVRIRFSYFTGTEGFQELLTSGNLEEKRLADKYSFASYRDGSLLFEYGSYPYGLTPSMFIAAASDSTRSMKSEGQDHLVLNPEPGVYNIISRPAAGLLSLITLFSWLVCLFGILFFSLFVVNGYLSGKKSPVSLTRRIRLSVFTLVILSFVGAGTGTALYILQKYDDDQRRDISEQLNGLWILLGDQLGLGTPFSQMEPSWLKKELDRINTSTNIDFDLYDEQGRLFYSSEQRLFDQAIISDRMDPDALHELDEFGKTQFVHRERIGELNYLAAYAPFIGTEGKTAGYLRLPYFEKQYERSREVSGFLSALLNIYILLFAAAVFVTIFISSRVTRPLAVIQERLAAIRFGRRNEAITYPVNDEIGQLVREYNRMVGELAESAEKLARSERESAWREMAKQVAHEIKNPLTPMRLSIQHVQRAWNEQSVDREALTQRMAKTLIEQIDTLSHIATEFSNFAKMPAAAPEQVDLRDILSNALALFSQSYPIEFHFSSPSTSPFPVIADKEQLNRIFSNLLKNAVQAIPEGKQGRIDVRLIVEPTHYHVEVEDNGTGIPEKDQGRIFVPNFTTKSGGTGLGLAMVKNMVEQGGGSVSFDSKEGVGTVFHVRWPRTTGIV